MHMLYTPKSKAVVEKSMTNHVNSNQNYCGLTRKLKFMSAQCHNRMDTYGLWRGGRISVLCLYNISPKMDHICFKDP